MKKIIVIGGGVSGLATASLLAKQGHIVTLLEKNTEVGGRGRQWYKDGFKFDMGPSWYMMPEIFEKFLAIFDKKVADYYQLLRLPIHYRVFFDQNRTYDIKTELAENIKTFESIEPGAGKKLQQYLNNAQEIYDRAMQDLVYFDYDNLSELIQPALLPYLFKAKFFQNFHQYVSQIFKNKDLQKIIEFTTVFLGGSPYITPAFYRLISHTDFNLGIWYPHGGMVEIFKMLEKVALSQEVKIIKNSEVTQIIVNKGMAAGVKVDQKKYTADIIVSGADYWWTETQLLDQQWQSYDKKFWNKSITSPSALVIYLGLNKRIKNLEHHNLYFHDSWEEGFADVYQKQRWPENPSYYVHVPSLTDRSVCPKNSEAIMILVPVAPGLKDSPEIRKSFADKVITHLEKISQEKIKENIVVQRIFSHQDFSQEYHAQKGAAFGLAHTLKQTALFRPKNRSKKVKNLFYVGQNTNPGVGVPIGLISAMIVDKMISKNYK